MRWADVDLSRRVWTIPADQAKAGDTLHVYLSDDAMSVIRRRAKRRCDEIQYVFPGYGATGHITELLAPRVGRVIAVDESGPMLSAGRERLSQQTNVEFRAGSVEDLPIEDGALDAAILFLVAHFIADPEVLMREVQRVLKPGGKLLLVDFIIHDRSDYAIQLGHVWQGFDEEQVTRWLQDAGFTSCRYRELSADPDAKGPALFAATARKKRR